MVNSLHFTENTMSLRGTCLILLVLSVATGCREDNLVPPSNKIPVARARVKGSGGKFVNDRTTEADAAAKAAHQMMLEFPLANGQTEIEITLDGTASTDEDGEIVKYIWLSGTKPPAMMPGTDGGVTDAGADSGATASDAGMASMAADSMGKLVGGRYVPDSVPASQRLSWPDDKAQPKVKLPQGFWTFSLWVEDNRGAISAPDTISIKVGQAFDPGIAECEGKVYSVLTDDCRSCVCQKKACQSLVTLDACDETCWGLINCIVIKCPNLASLPMSEQTACVTTNCSMYLTSKSIAALMGASSCLMPCAAACPTMPL